MKVLFVLPRFSLGGAERVLTQLANRFADRGIETLLFAFSGHGPLRAEVSTAVRLICCTEHTLSLFGHMRAAQKLFLLLRTERPDAVASTLFQANMLVSAVHFITRSEARLVLREAILVSKEWPKSRFYAVARLIGPVLYRRADLIVVPAADQTHDLCKTLGVEPSKVHTIGNPIIGRWMEERSWEPIPESIEGLLESPLVVAVGRLCEQKGFDVLIRAFAKHYLRRGGRLLILGDGTLRSELEQLAERLGIREFVFMPGIDVNPFRYLRRADLFVLSSRYEGLPNALAQAVAFGVRCVSTDCPSGPRELLQEGALGRLVPVDDVEALADAMSAALDDPPCPPPPDWCAKYDEEAIVEQYVRALVG